MNISVNDIVYKNQANNIMIVDRHSSKNILFLGSCRITPFINYFANDPIFNSYNILGILIHIPEMAQLSKALLDNEEVKNDIYNSTIFIHEYIKHFDYLNTCRKQDKHIFQIKDTFETVICLPNYQNPAIYAQDIIYYHIFNEFYIYLNKTITFQEFTDLLKKRQQEQKEKYYTIISKSSLPELNDFVINNIDSHRIAHTINHPTNLLFLKMYEIILKKFFNRDTVCNEVIHCNKTEFLTTPGGYSTKLTYYDKILGITINEEYMNEEDSNIYLDNLIKKK
jgi:hypothetical protein